MLKNMLFCQTSTVGAGYIFSIHHYKIFFIYYDIMESNMLLR